MRPVLQRLRLFLEEQVIQNEPQIRLPRAVVGEGDGAALFLDVLEQRFDELK
ncbi:hypothetical protein D3C87_1812470 [compost metagenome]